MVSSGKQRTIGEKLSAAGLTVRGKDGQDYHMRPIRPSDAASLIRGYDALSDRGKRFRMFSVIPHLSEEMAADFCSPDPESEVCVVVDGRGTLKGEILGGARLADMGPGRAAEFSVSMRPEARGLGLARQALETVIDLGREAGCASVWGAIAARNEAMLNLATRISFTLSRDPDDFSVIRAEMAL